MERHVYKQKHFTKLLTGFDGVFRQRFWAFLIILISLADTFNRPYIRVFIVYSKWKQRSIGTKVTGGSFKQRLTAHNEAITYSVNVLTL